MTTLLQDLRYALRQMRHAPSFTFSVVLVLALGIGANSAMFTVLEATIFRPLPYYDAEKLVRFDTFDRQGTPNLPVLPDITAWQQRARSVSQIAYYVDDPAYLLSQGAEQKVTGVAASSNLFNTLGVSPALGRSFTATEQQLGKGQVVVLSDAVWRAQFHADPAVLGQTVRIDDKPVTVIGVMPRNFAFPAGGSAAQIWTPAQLKPKDLTRVFDASEYRIVARRQPGVSIAAVGTEITEIQKQLLPLYADPSAAAMAPVRIEPIDYRRSLNAKDQRIALLALLGAVAVLWLIACANVACLMLARTAARRREMAVRAALGASGWRLARQTLAESLLLSATGGALGLLFSQIMLGFLRHSLTTQLSPDLVLHADARVLLALFSLTILSGVLLGIVPARLASRIAVEQALRQDSSQTGTGRGQHRLQRILVVSELSMTLVMLVCCGLLLRTVFALKKVPLGFRTDHLLVIDPHLPDYKYEHLDASALVYKPLLDRLKTVPGVQSAAIVTVAPLEKGFGVRLTLGVSHYGKKGEDANSVINATLRASGPELQQVLGFGMVRGRYFNAQDTISSPLVAVVNKAFAQRYESGSGDVGKFTMNMDAGGDAKARSFKIVGVVDDLHQTGIAEPAMPEIDVNAAQLGASDAFYQITLRSHAEIILRSTRDAHSLVPEINRIMRQSNPDLASADIRSMDQIVEDAMGSQILAAHLLELLGGLALLVALAGLYSLLTYLVTLRTRELGLRLALGAQRGDILTLVLRGALVLLLSGTVVGVGFSLIAAHLMRSFLFGVKQNDVITLVSVPILLLLVGTFAALLPARRASILEPMQALRTE
jgi:predicted permease